MTQGAFLQTASALLDQKRDWAGLGGDSLAFVLSQVAVTGRWLVVVDEPDAANRLLRSLQFFYPKPKQLCSFPAYDCRPYDGFSPSPGVVRRRIVTIDRVQRGSNLLVVAPVRSLAQRIPDTERMAPLDLRAGQTLERAVCARRLTEMGYIATDQVQNRGFYSVRGDLVDVWPTGLSKPIRLEFFDDELEQLRSFDPKNGRTIARRERVRILLAREERIDNAALRSATSILAKFTTEQRRDNRMRRRVLEDLKMGVRFSGIEEWLPGLGPTVSPLQLFDGFRRLVIRPDDVSAAMREFGRNAQERWAGLEIDERPLVPPTARYMAVEEVINTLKGSHNVRDLAVDAEAVDLGARAPDGYSVRGTDLKPMVKKLRDLASAGVRVGLVCATQKKADTLLEMLARHDVFLIPRSRPEDCLPEQVAVLVGELPRGFISEDSGWAFIPATALFGGRRKRARMDRIHAFFDASVRSVSQIREGDYVVHRLHGVGRYQGLQRLDTQDGVVQDFARVVYRNDDLFFLPVTRLGEFSRYVPSKEGAKVKLDRLGGQSWESRKGKVRDSLLAMAQQLIAVAARREIATRPPYPPAGELYDEFEARFPYEETHDQLKAIEAIGVDLSLEVPMDRLLCGDVGFGKTEVAMRAVMRVVEAGRQAAVLCPTTVLAYQHRQTFKERFEHVGVRIAMLSRFQTAKESTQIIKDLGAGKLDVLVGTTALLGREVRFPNLGLLVVDEEHRFGVRQKERIKRIRTAVDVLSMSATPIPRTLQMGLSGLREMSMMATPPQDRLSVRTSVARLGKTRVRDAVLHELQRSGQVFFVHNRVESIEKMAERLQEWVPEARFCVAHGKMDSRKLEGVLLDFLEKRFDVLVCTAIMENGIDMPNVNTMLINRADQFGLAQLYQLRGRVGRGSVRANCLMLVPEDLTGESRRRVQVMAENTRLGSGFSIAAADLEMRGAGNLLGDSQSGNIDAVGYEVWLELLEQAVRRARGLQDSRRIDPQVEIPVPAFISDKMIPDTQDRLAWYQRMANANKPVQVDHYLDELEAQYGELPVEVRNLGGLMQIQLYCQRLGIEELNWLKVRVRFRFHETSAVDTAAIEKLAAAMPKRVSVEGEGKISVRFTPAESERPFPFLRWILARLERENP